MMTYRCKVTLRGATPPIWRRFEVPSGVTLFHLHQVLQTVMGWFDGHLHQFEHAGTSYGLPNPKWADDLNVIDERHVALSDLLRRPKDRLTYEYDFGDGWRHDVVLEAKLDTPSSRARVTAGARACPPEDVGGLGGYARFLHILRTSSHPEHDDMKEWIGRPFDPAAFDMDQVNAELPDLDVRAAVPARSRRTRPTASRRHLK